MNASPPSDFQWQRQGAAFALVQRLVDHCIKSNPHIATLAQRLHNDTGTRLIDWTFHLGVAADTPNIDSLPDELIAAGFVVDPDSRRQNGYHHHAGIFPTISVAPSGVVSSLFIKVDNVDNFRAAWEPVFGPMKCSGDSGCPQRQAWIIDEPSPSLHAIECHGWRSPAKPIYAARQIAAAAKHHRSFATRRRTGAPDAELIALAAALFDAASADLGSDWACDLFFAAERDYWMSRNAAARTQYARQQTLGLGWANHDHHTYRSSRQHFAQLIGLFERMGFECREQFYAGRDAGWGAQILEQPRAGIVVFADVDLGPEELGADFAHQPLPARDKLGGLGLWCALHGEAILAAGMHHLECQFDYAAAQEQLGALGVEMMPPFTDWPHLKQAFTKAEFWEVAPERIDAALAGGFITAEQADQFRTQGALGSHFEILERNDGYKGFNQTGINEIIGRTDPRNG